MRDMSLMNALDCDDTKRQNGLCVQNACIKMALRRDFKNMILLGDVKLIRIIFIQILTISSQ